MRSFDETCGSTYCILKETTEVGRGGGPSIVGSWGYFFPLAVVVWSLIRLADGVSNDVRMYIHMYLLEVTLSSRR